MKAARVHAWSELPVVEECPDPPRPAGASLVRVEAATVGHVDRTIWSGGFLRPPPLPYTPGVEGAGVIVESDRFDPGERVWIRGGGLGTTLDGTWAEMVAAPDHALGTLPEAVPFTVGAGFFSPCASAWISVHDIAHVQAGERVIVTGATGAVGALAVQMAAQAGASVTGVVTDVSAVGPLPAGVETMVVDRRSPAVPEELAADVLIDTVGGRLLSALLASITSGGRAVLVGYVGGAELTLDLRRFVQRDVALLPLNMMRREPAGRALASQLLAQLADGRLHFDVTAFPLTQSGAALDWLVTPGHRGRAVLVTGRPSGQDSNSPRGAST